MVYEAEDLMEIVAKLSRKYTSGESSSVTYETAQMLMGAVMYCVNEYKINNRNELMMPNKGVKLNEIYRQGYELVIAKVYKTKELYENLIKNFNDYGCRNCRDTIIKGIPHFFSVYDVKFNPQDHILTLDYPVMDSIEELTGIDRIHQYLHDVQIEWMYLHSFSSERIIKLLERTIPDYRDMYFGNIAYHTMLTSIGCFLADKPVSNLMLEAEDVKEIAKFFEGTVIEEAKEKVNRLISILIPVKGKNKKIIEAYFKRNSEGYAVRIVNGMEHQSLHQIFGLECKV